MYKKLVTQAHTEGIKRFCVRAMIINNDSILLLQRSIHDSFPGIYELPGGAVDHKENLDTALKREVNEETGLLINEIDHYLGHYDFMSKKYNLLIRQFNFVTKINDQYSVVISSEHDDFKWIHLELIKSVNLPINESIFDLIDKYKKILKM